MILSYGHIVVVYNYDEVAIKLFSIIQAFKGLSS